MGAFLLTATVHAPDLEGAIDRLTRRAGPRLRPTPHRGPFAFHRILVGVADDAVSRHALLWAGRVAQTFHAKVWVTHAVLPVSVYEDYAEWAEGGLSGARLFAEEDRRATRLVRAAAARLGRLGVDAEPLTLHGFPIEAIPKAIRQESIDLLVVGARSESTLERLVIGSLADSLKNRVPCSVLIARGPPGRRLVLATDGSPPSRRAAGIGYRLANLWGGHATVLHVLEAPVVAGRPAEPRASVLGQLGLPRDDDRLSFALQAGKPAERIVEVARTKDADLIVMGSRGLGRVRGWVAGSVSNRVANHAETSVLLVKDPMGA